MSRNRTGAVAGYVPSAATFPAWTFVHRHAQLLARDLPHSDASDGWLKDVPNRRGFGEKCAETEHRFGALLPERRNAPGVAPSSATGIAAVQVGVADALHAAQIGDAAVRR